MRTVWNIYKLNDYDWWMAPTVEEACIAALVEWGDEEFIDRDAKAMTEEELERRKFITENGVKISFKEELDRRIKEGPKIELFASTEF